MYGIMKQRFRTFSLVRCFEGILRGKIRPAVRITEAIQLVHLFIIINDNNLIKNKNKMTPCGNFDRCMNITNLHR